MGHEAERGGAGDLSHLLGAEHTLHRRGAAARGKKEPFPRAPSLNRSPQQIKFRLGIGSELLPSDREDRSHY